MLSFSIIVPTYNNVGTLQKTIENLLSIKYEKYEIIIVNDGSTDGTSEYLDKINNKKLTVITQENAGVSRARNNGMLRAKGDYLIFVDDDDELDITALKKLNEIIENNNMPEIVRFSGFASNCEGEKTRIKYIKEEVIYSGNNKKINKMLFSPAHKIDCYVWLLAIKRTRDIALFNCEMNYLEDEMFYVENFRIKNRRIVISNELLYTYKYNQKSKTKNVDKIYENFEDLIKSRRELQRINKDDKRICAMITANVFRLLFARYNNARKVANRAEVKKMRRYLLKEMKSNSIKLNHYYPMSLIAKYAALKVGIGV